MMALPMAPQRSRAEVPLGTIVMRSRDARGHKARFIKIRMDGPSPYRWMPLARWWWIHHRGAIPPGKCVIHVDGNTLNDDPSNYELATPGDVIFLAHERDPRMSRRNRLRCGRAAAASNRARAMVRRARECLPSKWYPVDHVRRFIYNAPERKQWMVYRAWGVAGDGDAGGNGRGFDAAALGWRQLKRGQASILAAIADAGAVSRLEASKRVQELYRVRGWPPLGRGSFLSALSSLWTSGRIVVKVDGIRGGRRHELSISQRAIDERTVPCPVIPIRGEQLLSEPYLTFQREAAPATSYHRRKATCADANGGGQ